MNIAELDWIGIGGYLMSPLTGVVSYFAGKRGRNNDFLQHLQNSINMLSQKNSELLTELVAVKEQNAQLTVTMAELKIDNKSLRDKVETLTQQLENVRTITKVEKSHA
ncbi:MAG: hypothetical protein CVU12_02035 [Bacteroidetes bacterium HGW-Bacteroidetes-7]|jgi:predicted nuclease with TOPRIM domain|nr:MAG: hypothetical protein CVU12_02035 [Bacteroidetes bacterium HGW-Bacteroidetes-7]